MEVVSGSLQFQLSMLSSFHENTSKYSQLNKFLREDAGGSSDKSLQYSECRQQLAELIKHRRNHTENYSSTAVLNSSNILGDLSGKTLELKGILNRINYSHNAQLLKSVLLFTDLQKFEIEEAKADIIKEKDLIKGAKSRIVEYHTFKMFLKCLDLESNRKIEISPLSEENSQFSRCCKAFYDNLDPSLRENPMLDIKVSKVLKVQHLHLTNLYQESLLDIGDGKVKGLFCYIPKEFLYEFCAYGLFCQEFESLSLISDSNLQSPSLRSPNSTRSPTFFGSSSSSSSGAAASSSSISPSSDAPSQSDNASQSAQIPSWEHWIQPPWFAFRPGHKMTSIAKTLQYLESRIPYQRNAPSFPLRIFRFSKFCRLDNLSVGESTTSTSSSTTRNPIEASDTGFLALCRVVVSNLKVVSAPNWNSKLFDEAKKINCHVLYCPNSEEYVFLKPSLVLPEFIIQVQFQPKSSSCSPSLASPLAINDNDNDNDNDPSHNNTLSMNREKLAAELLQQYLSMPSELRPSISPLSPSQTKTATASCMVDVLRENGFRNQRKERDNGCQGSSLLVSKDSLNGSDRNSLENKSNVIEKQTIVLDIHDSFVSNARVYHNKMRTHLRSLASSYGLDPNLGSLG